MRNRGSHFTAGEGISHGHGGGWRLDSEVVILFLPYHFHCAVRGGGTHFRMCGTRGDSDEGKNTKQVGPRVSRMRRVWKTTSGSMTVRGRGAVL